MSSFAPRRKAVRAVRSEEEIQRQLDDRVDELEAEARKLRQRVVCRDCRFARGIYCVCPLVTGFGGPVFQGSSETDICGPEKVLWREKLPLWQRLVAWVTR